MRGTGHTRIKYLISYRNTRLPLLRWSRSFSITPTCREQTKEQRHSEQRAGPRQDERHERSNYTSIRPITVFALCIPAGYALNWALKRQDDIAEVTRNKTFRPPAPSSRLFQPHHQPLLPPLILRLNALLPVCNSNSHSFK